MMININYIKFVSAVKVQLLMEIKGKDPLPIAIKKKKCNF